MKSPETVPQQVALFLKTYREVEDTLVVSPSQSEVLGNLAYDLEFFVPDPVHRREDPSYYGPDRALDEILGALSALKSGEA